MTDSWGIAKLRLHGTPGPALEGRARAAERQGCCREAATLYAEASKAYAAAAQVYAARAVAMSIVAVVAASIALLIGVLT